MGDRREHKRPLTPPPEIMGTVSNEFQKKAQHLVYLVEQLYGLKHRGDLNPEELSSLEAVIASVNAKPLPNDNSPESLATYQTHIERVQEELDKYNRRHTTTINWENISPEIFDPKDENSAGVKSKIEQLFDRLRKDINIIFEPAERAYVQSLIEQIENPKNKQSFELERNALLEALLILHEKYKFPTQEFVPDTGRLTLFDPSGKVCFEEISGFFKDYDYISKAHQKNAIAFTLTGFHEIEINIQWDTTWKKTDPAAPTIESLWVLFDRETFQTTATDISSVLEEIKSHIDELNEQEHDSLKGLDNDVDNAFAAFGNEEPTKLPTEDTAPDGDPGKTAEHGMIVTGELARETQIHTAFETFRRAEQAADTNRYRTDADITKIYDTHRSPQEILHAIEEHSFLGQYLVVARMFNPLQELELTPQELRELSPAQQKLYTLRNKERFLTYIKTSLDLREDIPLEVGNEFPSNLRASVDVYTKIKKYNQQENRIDEEVARLVLDQTETEGTKQYFWALEKSSYENEREHALSFLEHGWLEVEEPLIKQWVEKHLHEEIQESPYVSIAIIPLTENRHGSRKIFLRFDTTLRSLPESIAQALQETQGTLRHYLLKSHIPTDTFPDANGRIQLGAEREFVELDIQSGTIGFKEGETKLSQIDVFLLSKGWTAIEESTLKQWFHPPGNFFATPDTKSRYLDVITVRQEDGRFQTYVSFSKLRNLTKVRETTQILSNRGFHFVHIYYPLIKSYQNNGEIAPTIQNYVAPEQETIQYFSEQFAQQGFVYCPNEQWEAWKVINSDTKKEYGTEAFPDDTNLTVVTIVFETAPDKKMSFIRAGNTPFNPTKEDIFEGTLLYEVEQYLVSKDKGLIEMQEKKNLLKETAAPQKTRRATPPPLPKEVTAPRTASRATPPPLPREALEAPVERPTMPPPKKQSWFQKKLAAPVLAAFTRVASLFLPALREKSPEATPTVLSPTKLPSKSFFESPKMRVLNSVLAGTMAVTNPYERPTPEYTLEYRHQKPETAPPEPEVVSVGTTPDELRRASKDEHTITVERTGQAISRIVIDDIIRQYKEVHALATKNLRELKQQVTRAVSAYVVEHQLPWMITAGDKISYKISLTPEGTVQIESIQHEPPDPVAAPDKRPTPPPLPKEALEETPKPREKVITMGEAEFTVGEEVEYLPMNKKPRTYTVLGTSKDGKLLLKDTQREKAPPIRINAETAQKRIPDRNHETYNIDGLWVEDLSENEYQVRFSTMSGKGMIKALATLILEKEYRGNKGEHWTDALKKGQDAFYDARNMKDTYDENILYPRLYKNNLFVPTDSFVVKRDPKTGSWQLQSVSLSRAEKKTVRNK